MRRIGLHRWFYYRGSMWRREYMHKDAIEKLNDMMKHLEWHEKPVEAHFVAQVITALGGIPWIKGATTAPKW